MDKQCCESITSPVVVCEESKMRFVLKNPEKVEVTKCIVDGCLITGEEERCDFWLHSESKERGFLVELKGTDRRKAISQILNSAKHLRTSSFNYFTETYIVTSATPRADTSFQKELLRRRNEFSTLKLKMPLQKNRLIEILL